MAAGKVFPAVQAGVLRFAGAGELPAWAEARGDGAGAVGHSGRVATEAEPEQFAIVAEIDGKNPAGIGSDLHAEACVGLVGVGQDVPSIRPAVELDAVRADGVCLGDAADGDEFAGNGVETAGERGGRRGRRERSCGGGGSAPWGLVDDGWISGVVRSRCRGTGYQWIRGLRFPSRVHNPLFGASSLNGSALGLGIDWTRRKIPSVCQHVSICGPPAVVNSSAKGGNLSPPSAVLRERRRADAFFDILARVGRVGEGGHDVDYDEPPIVGVEGFADFLFLEECAAGLYGGKESPSVRGAWENKFCVHRTRSAN